MQCSIGTPSGLLGLQRGRILWCTPSEGTLEGAQERVQRTKEEEDPEVVEVNLIFIYNFRKNVFYDASCEPPPKAFYQSCTSIQHISPYQTFEHSML